MGNTNSKPTLDFDFYQFVCKNKSETDETYIGSTSEWDARMGRHKSACNNRKDKSYNYKVYKTMREFGGWDNWKILKIDHLEKICKTQAHIHEQYLMEKYGSTMNSQRAKRTEEQRREQQRIGIKKHGEKNPNYDKDRCEKNSATKYRENNIATIEEKFECEICRGKYTHENKQQHLKTNKHKKAVKN